MKLKGTLTLIVLLVIVAACAAPATPQPTPAPSSPTAAPTATVPASTPTPAATPTTTRTTTPTPPNNRVTGAIEFETLPIKMANTLTASAQDTTSFGVRQWSNDKQLFGTGKEGSAITFDVPVSTTARYALDLYLTLGPDFAILLLTLDGKKYGPPIDLYASKVSPSGRIPAGGFDLSAGTHELGFRIVGKNPASSNYRYGLDCFTLTPSQTVALAITPVPTPTVTPPPPNPAHPLLTVEIQPVQMADDDGKRLTEITTDQVKQWIDKANEIWAGAGIRFLYDPDSAMPIVKNTLVNSMEEPDPKARENRPLANEIAARYPGKLVILFRWGPGVNPTGKSFSGTNGNFVASVRFNNITCGQQIIWSVAHEIGHYLGLHHTFPQTFASIQEAEAYMKARGNKPSVFDGDGFSDTPPDPYIDVAEIACKPVPSVNVNGFDFPLPRTNTMSYYFLDRTGLSPQQIERARYVLEVRAKNGMAIPPGFR